MDARLIVVAGRATKREISLTLPAIIGRSREADLTIGHPHVSRQHCMLLESDGLLLVRDLGSTNGTFYDGQRIIEAALLPDEKFSVGPLVFRVAYEYRGDVTAVPPPQPAPIPEGAHAASPPATIDDGSPWSSEPAALDSKVLEVPIAPHAHPQAAAAGGSPTSAGAEPPFDAGEQVEFEPVEGEEESEASVEVRSPIAPPPGRKPPIPRQEDQEKEPEPAPPPNPERARAAQPVENPPSADPFQPGPGDEVSLDDFTDSP